MPKGDKEISFVVGKNVSLVGFDELDESEQGKAQEILSTYIKKVEDRTDYDELKIRLKQHHKAKMFVHEIKAELFLNPGTVLSANSTNKNVYRALADVMANILAEVNHRKKGSSKERPIRKFNRKVI
ncbi:MAG: hypothetical protein K6T16_02225 [Candidatus Pacearchaeota archaeon]|nr:hypothetical protein [Candidatus Pacearchaeota archaeon]